MVINFIEIFILQNILDLTEMQKSFRHVLYDVGFSYRLIYLKLYNTCVNYTVMSMMAFLNSLIIVCSIDLKIVSCWTEIIDYLYIVR